MSDRRNRPANRWGCKPTEDVCVEHDLPLECPHGCYKAKFHKCAWMQRPGWRPSVAPENRDVLDDASGLHKENKS